MALFKRLGNRGRPSAKQAAKRLLILKYVAGYALAAPPRAMLTQWSQNWSDKDRAEFARKVDANRDKIWGQVRALGLWDETSLLERELSKTTALTMTHQQQVNASWRIEAAQTLMWALGLLADLPPYGTQAGHELLAAIPSQDAKFVKSARLHPQETIDKARDLAEFWHWRSRTRQLIEEGRALNPDPKMRAAGFETFDDIVRFSANASHEKGELDVIDGDFAVGGKAYRDLSAEEWDEVRSITVERHFALNWLCGYAPNNRWDETPMDT